MAQITNQQETIDRNQDTSTYSSDDYDRLKAEFDQLNPAQINITCNSWSRFASHMGTIANTLLSQAAAPLHAAWQSKTSPQAQQQLQLAQATAQALADQGIHMARANDWAYNYAQWYKDHAPGPGYITTQSDTNALNEHRVKLLSRYNEVIATCIPPQVQSSFVQNSNPDQGTFKKTPGPGPGPGPTGPGPGPGPTNLPVTPIHPGPTHPGPTSPGPTNPGPTSPGPINPGPINPGPIDPGPTGPGGPGPGSPGGITPIGPGSPGGAGIDTGSTLAGFDPSGAGAGGLGASGLGASGAGGLGAGGLGPSGLGAGGLGAGGLGAGGLGAGGLGASGLRSSGLGAAGTGSGAGLAGGFGSGGGLGAGAGGAGSGAGAGAGAGGAGAGAGAGGGARGIVPPLHGNGQQGGDNERERNTWLTEDDDIWGGQDAPPGLISG